MRDDQILRFTMADTKDEGRQAAVAELDAFGEQAGFLRWMARILADREK